MLPKVELNQIRDLGQVVDDSILFLKQNFKPLLKSYFTICGVLWLAEAVIGVVNQIQTIQRIQDGDSVFSLAFFIVMFLGFLNYTLLILTILSYITLYRDKDKETPTVEEVWTYVKYYFFRMFGGSLVLLLALAAGTVCCFFPGIYLYPILILVPAIMVIENTSFRYAFNRSFQIIKKRWGQVFGVTLVIGVIIISTMPLVAIPTAIIAVGVKFVALVNTNTVFSVALSIGLHLVQVLFILPVIASAMLYFSLTEQKDDANLLSRIEMLGHNVPETDHTETEDY